MLFEYVGSYAVLGLSSCCRRRFGNNANGGGANAGATGDVVLLRRRKSGNNAAHVNGDTVEMKETAVTVKILPKYEKGHGAMIKLNYFSSTVNDADNTAEERRKRKRKRTERHIDRIKTLYCTLNAVDDLR